MTSPLPNTCPFCGEGVAVNYNGQPQKSELRVVYQCCTVIVDAYERQCWQSNKCEKSQQAQAVEKVRELESRIAILQAENRALCDRFAEVDTDHKSTKATLRAAVVAMEHI